MNTLPRLVNSSLDETCAYNTTCLTEECPSSAKPEGSSRTELSPEFTSESICLLSLKNAIPPKSKNHLTRTVRTLDTGLDLAMALSVHDKEAARVEYHNALRTLEEIDTVNLDWQVRNGRLKYLAHAQGLEAFLPAIQDRIECEPVDPISAAQVHANLCNILRDFDSRHYNGKGSIGTVESIRSEFEIMGLLTRPGRQAHEDLPQDGFVFAATLREEESPAHSEFNHDLSYTYDNYTKKVPIQIKYQAKTDKNDKKDNGRRQSKEDYDDSVLIVYFKEIRKVMQEKFKEISASKLRQTNDHDIPEAPTTTQLLLREQRLGRLKKGSDTDETSQLLDAATGYIESLLVQHVDSRTDL